MRHFNVNNNHEKYNFIVDSEKTDTYTRTQYNIIVHGEMVLNIKDTIAAYTRPEHIHFYYTSGRVYVKNRFRFLFYVLFTLFLMRPAMTHNNKPERGLEL